MSQNLVQNGSFEDKSACPNVNSQITLANNWFSGYNGTLNGVAYFNACASSPNYGVPTNVFGNQPARTGVAYALSFLPQCAICSRGYIVNHLVAPLVGGRTYYFEMYLSLSDISTVAHNKIGVYFSNTTTTNSSTFIKPFSPQIITPTYITDKSNWVQVSGSYTASGGEEWITIGSFAPYSLADYTPVPDGNPTFVNSAWYYVDDVYLGDNCNIPSDILGPNMSICADSTTITRLNAATPNGLSYLWNNGTTQPYLDINKSGTYWVKITSGMCIRYDTINVVYRPLPKVDLGPDTTLCTGQSLTLGKNIGSVFYAWDDNTVIGPFRTVTQSGIYWLLTINAGCRAIDSITVSVAAKPPVNLGPDRILCKNQTLTLSSSTLDSTYKWNTGNTTATITTDTPGTFWLEVNNKGCRNIDTLGVHRTALRDFSLGPDSLICKGHPTRLVADSAQATSYVWVNGLTTPSIITDTAGIFWVDASLGSCIQRDSITITAKVGPVLNFPADLYTCSSNGLLVDAQNSGATYLWSNGSNTQQVLLSIPDNYWVMVTNNGCSVADTFRLNQQAPPVFDLGSNPFVCSDSVITLNASVLGATYKWHDGSTLATFKTSGGGKYKVEVTKGACTVADSVQVFTFPKPTFSLGPDKDYCLNTPLTLTGPTADTYLWQDGSSANTFQVTLAGTYWVKIKRSVCNASDTIVIGQLPVPIVNIGADKQLCKETSLLLTAQNDGSVYLWNNDSTSQTITVNAPGIFWVAVSNSNLCTTTDSIVLDTFTSPVVDLGKDTFTCRDSYYLLNAGVGFVSYTWSTGSTASFIQTKENGQYSVAVTDANGCTATDNMLLEVKEKPVLKMVHLMKICDPDTLLYPGAFKQYLWQDGSIDTAFRAKQYGVYTVEVTDSNDCSNSDSSEIINRCPGMLHVPNAFTPNNDFTNEVFIPSYRNIKAAIFKVYDRWGQLLFETTDMKTGWTGMVNGSVLNLDMYVYMVTYTGMDDETHTKSGNVTLLK
ncbi:MAG: gliding motility-associated C-terminal domain-containing protein [Bacteroidota bacterium]